MQPVSMPLVQVAFLKQMIQLFGKGLPKVRKAHGCVKSKSTCITAKNKQVKILHGQAQVNSILPFMENIARLNSGDAG